MSVSRRVISISLRDKIKIYALALFYGFWVFVKRISRLLWKKRSKTQNADSENAPLAYIDVNVGQHSFMKIKGVKIHYIELGEKSSPPLLLLHGFPDCWIGWKAQLRFLSTQYRVIAIDLKGFGDSDKPAIRYHYRLPQVIVELRSVLIFLTENTVHRTVTVLGHDLGGTLSWFLAHDSPELIEKLVIVSAPHPNVYWNSIQKNSPLNYKWMYVSQLPWLPESEALHDDMKMLTSCCPHLLNTPTLLEVYKYVFSRHEDWTGPLNYFRNLIFWRIEDDSDIINIPILLINGSNDPQIPLESMVRSSEWCSNSNLKIVDGVGHFPHQEAPEKFNRFLLKFLINEKKLQVNEKSDVLDVGVTGAAKDLVGRLFGSVHLFS